MHVKFYMIPSQMSKIKNSFFIFEIFLIFCEKFSKKLEKFQDEISENSKNDMEFLENSDSMNNKYGRVKRGPKIWHNSKSKKQALVHLRGHGEEHAGPLA